MKRLATSTLAFVAQRRALPRNCIPNNAGMQLPQHLSFLGGNSASFSASCSSSDVPRGNISSASSYLSALSTPSVTLPTMSERKFNTKSSDDSGSALRLPRPVVICGPSGVGKGTIIEKVMQQFPEGAFGFSVSHTTRAPRPGEIHGRHYNFTTIPAIQNAISSNQFVEHAKVHGNYYGTSYDAIESVRSQNKICILDIDVQGVRNVKESSLDCHYVFVAPPSLQLLEERLRGRGTEEEESIQKRLGNARAELEYGYEEGQFEKIVINDELEAAVQELAETLRGWYPSLRDRGV